MSRIRKAVNLKMAEREYLKVGSYTPPDENGSGEKIECDFYGQGWIFKDDEAFYDWQHPDRVCYIPELSDTKYTRNSILQECNGQTDLAEEIYETVDWQHVSSLLEEWKTNGELDTCKECGKMFNSYGKTKCPYCGAKCDDEGEERSMREYILSELVEAVKKVAGKEYEIMSHQVRKNNGVYHQAINCKRENELAAANVYVDQLIDAIAEKEMTITDAAKKIFEIAATNNAQKYCVDTSKLTDKEFILNHVEYQIVNKRRKQDQIDEMPHRTVLDLLVLYRVMIDSDKSGIASYVLNNKMLEQAGISIKELNKAADYNTKKAGFEVRSMGEFMAEMVEIPGEDIDTLFGKSQIYVLTNTRRLYGATVLLYNNVFGNLADEVEDDLFILPSSIHECLAVPVAQMDSEGLAAMVREVNDSEVADEEILGYQVYRFSRVTRKLKIA